MKRTKQLGAVALAVILLACGPPPAAAFSTWGVNRPDGRTPNCPLDQGQVELLQQQFPSTRTDCGSGGPLICTQCMCLLARSTTTTLIKKCDRETLITESRFQHGATGPTLPLHTGP